ncbi:MAG: RNA polymerase factor sigma-54 [Proteiniphilum sp.]|nr:RNA polymerase factor sigma-54 [Proteiniphilum sp.]
MALRQHQEIKQTQKLSPAQMQMIKLIGLNSLELEDRVKQEMEENPALEEGNIISDKDTLPESDGSDISQEDIAMGDYLSEDDIPQYQINRWKNEQNTGFIESIITEDTSLYNFLIEQVRLLELTEQNELIAEYIIGNIDESGYLSRGLQAIANDLLIQEQIEVSVDELESILLKIKDLDPVGVGAADLQECLLIQLNRNEQSYYNELAQIIIRDYFEEFSKKQYDRILQNMEISKDDLKEAISEITSLNPKPGNVFGGAVETHLSDITPDFIIESYNGEITMHLNKRNAPELIINRSFSEMIKGYEQNKEGMSTENKQALMFIKQKVDNAKSFIDAIKQRQDTLQRTMESIIKFQYDFFISEDETMIRPMILKDISEDIDLNISTVSRVSSSKYLQLNGSIYPLKFFFSEAMQNSDGQDVSSIEIKAILKQTIDSENKYKPLSDSQITKILNDKGYVIARRTVAKYREQLGIPMVRLRKKL